MFNTYVMLTDCGTLVEVAVPNPLTEPAPVVFLRTDWLVQGVASPPPLASVLLLVPLSLLLLALLSTLPSPKDNVLPSLVIIILPFKSVL